MNYRRIATFTGWLWIITFVTSILARFFFYAPVLNHKGSYVMGAGRHTGHRRTRGWTLRRLISGYEHRR